jgi:hypothetical protein
MLSLDAVRHFKFVPTHHKGHNVKFGVHQKVRIQYINSEGEARTTSIGFNHLPHLFIGYADKFQRCPILLCLPGLFVDAQNFKYLTNEIASQIMDRFLDCARPHLPASQEQYMPTNATAAEAIASAGKPNSTYKAAPEYSIPSESLRDIWREFVLRSEADSKTSPFKHCFLIATAKGFKTTLRKESLLESMRAFKRSLELAFDLDRIDMTTSMVDIANDFCPLKTQGRFTFLWRTCCLEKQVKKLQDLFCDSKKGTTNIYHPGFLSDSATLTFEPPTRSVLHEAGCFYVQCYNSVYLLYSALKYMPHEHDDLVDLACDRRTYNGLASSSKVSHQKKYSTLIRDFDSDNESLLQMVSAGRDKSMSTRMEFRISFHLWQQLLDIATVEDSGEKEKAQYQHPIISLGYPSHVWSIPTLKYIDFLLGNFQKFVSAFHISQITAKNHITTDRSRLMASFLLCLQVFPTGTADRERVLWWNTQTVGESTARGLAFEHHLQEYRYAWFSSIIDWISFVFEPEVSAEVIMPTGISGWYNESNEATQGTGQAIDVCEELLVEFSDGRTGQVLLNLMAHLCLRQYRADCLESLKKDLLKRGIETPHPDDVVFNYNGVQAFFGRDPWLYRGNRSQCSTPHMLFNWLFGAMGSGSLKRTGFESRSYRNFTTRCRYILTDYPQLAASWTTILGEEFFAFHRIVPMPDISGGAFVSTAKNGGSRVWYSIRQGAKKTSWYWGKESWDHEPIEVDYPNTLTMSRLELVEQLRLY